MPNIVYVLTNPAMPGMVKIGMTEKPDVQSRMKELYSTGVPFPFECVIARQIEDNVAKDVEKALHTAFYPDRINASRELFELDPEQVTALLRVMPGEDVTPAGVQQAQSVPAEDREAAFEFERRTTRATEQGVLDSLNEDGRIVYERVLAIGKRAGMRINWGTTGFSLNAVVNGDLIVVCSGYPRSSERPGPFNQSIYSDLGMLQRKTHAPDTVVGDLRQKALDTGLFVPVGKAQEIRCTIDHTFTESEIDTLVAWLERIVEYTREPDDQIAGDSFHKEQLGEFSAEEP